MKMKGVLFAVTALAMGSVMACSRENHSPSGPPEKVTIAYAATTDAVLAEVAHVKGFYRQEGLEAVSHSFPYGKRALADLLAGKADFATVAETPVMIAIMNGEKISIIATIQYSKTANAIMARRDRGILTVGDLRGKRIASTSGTTSDFFLDAMLGVNGISRKDVEVIDLKAEAMADALARGYIDAISTFASYTLSTRKMLGSQIITTFQDKDIYRATFNMVASQEFIRKNPEKVKKVLRALVTAEEFVRKNPEEAQKAVAEFSGIDVHEVRNIWNDTEFTVTLDQALVLALEDESQWAIKNRLTEANRVPNYLENIYRDGLLSVAPKAVRILK